MPSWFGQGSTGERSAIVLTVLLILSLASVTLYVREGEGGIIHNIQQNFSGLAAPLKAVSGAVTAGEESIAERITDAQADPNSIVSLREQNEQLRSTIAQLEEYRQEAIRLEGLLEMRTTYSAQGIPGRILSRSLDAWNRIVTINVGEADGVRAGYPVMGPSGLIGQVVSTTDTTADIRLLTDPQSGVAVIIQSSREEGIVHGSLEGLLYLEDLGDEVSVKPGDVLLTSGLGGGYFRGIMVGTVLKVEGEAGATTRKIIVEPNGGAGSVLEEVYVVTSMTSTLIPETDDTSTDTATTDFVDLDGDGIPDDASVYDYSYDTTGTTEGGF